MKTSLRRQGKTEYEYRPWTEQETALILEHWPKGGLRVCRPLFPDRNAGSIKNKASGLNLRIEGRAPIQRQPASEWIDAQIRRAYASGTPKLAALARRIDRKPGWIKWRANELGLRRSSGTEPNTLWTDAEDKIIESCIDRSLSLAAVQRHLRRAGHLRTLNAVRYRVWVRHGGFRRGHYTVREVSEIFGVSMFLVRSWIESGKLKAKKELGLSVDGLSEKPGIFHIQPAAISRFMRANLSAWDHRKMRKEVLIDFLLGEKEALGDLTQIRIA